MPPGSEATVSRSAAIVAPRYPEGGTVGGAETLLRQLALYLAEAGWSVDFLTTCAQDHHTWENSVPAGVRKSGPLNVHFFPVDADRDLRTFLSVQDAICAEREVPPEQQQAWLKNSVNSEPLFEHLRTHGERYDAILCGPYLFGLAYHAALIHPERTALVPCLHDESFAYLDCFRDLFHRVKRIIFNAEPERDLAARLYGDRFLAEPVVGMGLDAFDADPSRFRRERGIDAPYLIYCGRREPLKGTPLMVDYFRAFRERTGRDLKLVLTGAGSVDIPESIREHVHDLGFVSEQEKHDAMAGALAFCHPSTNESFGIVLMESWLAGRPALVHAGGDVLPTHCRQANGGLWFRRYPQFEEEVLLLLDQPDIATALGAAGKHYVNTNYSHAATTTRLIAALTD
jgi:glycosyltransferase involved in cell wall biosynthesis